MAFIPFGAELLGALPAASSIDNWKSVSKSWPVVKKNNVYILPSSPSLLTEKFLSILPNLKSSPLFLTTIIFRVDKVRQDFLLPILLALTLTQSVITENVANAGAAAGRADMARATEMMAVSMHETVNANSFSRTMDDGSVRTIVYLE
eukprot:651556-Hanusia_phi.AAC.1